MRTKLLNLVFVCLIAAPRAWAADIFIPSVVPEGEEVMDAQYELTGLIATPDSYGSGAVATHPRVVVSCAHVIFSTDVMAWTSGAEWFVRWNESSEPEPGTGELFSGYYYWRTYGPAAAATAKAYDAKRNTTAFEAREFNLDFVAYFHHSKDLASGEFAMSVENGAPLIADAAVEKTVTGYPQGRYGDEDPAKFRMHVTGPFDGAFKPELRAAKRYLTAYGLAETGSGNSGGPVWVEKPDGTKVLAAVLVSGQEQPESEQSMIGVHAVSPDGWRLIRSAQNAAGSGGPTESSFEISGGDIPDNWTLKRTVRVAKLPKTLVRATLDLEIEHPARSEVTVSVRAPGGKKTFVVYDGEQDENTGTTITLNAEQLSYLYGVNPNGVWTITVDDWAAGDEGQLVSGRLNLSAR